MLRSNGLGAAWVMTYAALCFAILPSASHGRDKSAPLVASMDVLPLRGALSLYDTACIRCHGPGGSFFGPDLGKGKTAAQLRKMVWEMCIAQGGLTVSQREIDAMTAYHRSIMAHEPYIEVIAVTESRVTGEATPGTVLELQVGSKVLPITLTENRWNVLVDTSKPAIIIATRNGKTTRLPVGLGKFTLHEP